MNPEVSNKLLELWPETVDALHMENFLLNFSQIQVSHLPVTIPCLGVGLLI